MDVLRRNNGFLPTFLKNFDEEIYKFNDGLERTFKKVAVNVQDRTEDYLIELSVPGLTRDAIEIDVEDGRMAIHGKVKTESEKTEENYTRKEFSVNSFSRTFTLPENVLVDDIKADYENGILKINVPKTKEKAKTKKRIEIAEKA